MRAGEIAVEDVARRFVVRARETQTLKELLIARGRIGAQEIWALDGVSAHVEPGEAVGLIGRNGSGKSTLLRLVAGIIKPTRGRVAAGGRVGSLLELGAGFHPDFTGRENVFLNGSVQGLRRAEIRERFDEIVAFAELEHAIDRPVRTYSSGMYMRLGFAIAAFLDADVLLLDEVFAVGDEAFQRKCFGRVAEFKQRGGTIVFVSHDAAAVERLCPRAVLLQDGHVAFDGPVHEALTRYRRQLAELAGGAGAALARSRAGRMHRSRTCGSSTCAGGSCEQLLAGEPLALEVALRASGQLPRTAAACLSARRRRAARGGGGRRHRVARVAARETAGYACGSMSPARRCSSAAFTSGSSFSRPTAGGSSTGSTDALSFVVYPDDDGRGLVRLGGTWSAGANEDPR